MFEGLRVVVVVGHPPLLHEILEINLRGIRLVTLRIWNE